MDAFRIRLFGSLEVSLGANRLPPFATRKSRSLFSYLLLHNERSHPRDLLAGTFWSEFSDATARKHLRDTLWRIRQVLRVAGRTDLELRVQHDSVALCLGPDCWLDTREFEAHLSSVATRPAHEISVPEAEHLQTAINLFRGDLLEEIYDDWCVYDRERLRSRALDAMERMMMYHLHRREWTCALQFGHRVLAADPLHEHVHRVVMRCYACSGNRGAAVRQYQTCARLLREELDLHPMPETISLFDGIRAGALPVPFEPPGLSATSSPWMAAPSSPATIFTT